MTTATSDSLQNNIAAELGLNSDPGVIDAAITNTVNAEQGAPYTTGLVQAAPAASNAVFEPGSANELIQFSGYYNTVLGNASDIGTAPLASGNDVVVGGLGNNVVRLGDGSDLVSLNGSLNVITLGNGDDIVSGDQGSSIVTVGGGRDTILLSGYNNVITAGDGSDLIAQATDRAQITAGNGDDTVLLGAARNDVVLGNGDDTVIASAGLNIITVGSGNDRITLAGYQNAVNAGSGNDTVSTGAGAAQIVLGGGNDLVSLSGYSNSVTLGGGADTVNAASGDAIFINGTRLTLNGGVQDFVYQGAQSATVSDASTDAVFVEAAGAGSLTINNLANDSGFTVDLAGGAGGYASAAAAEAALQSDGNGGWLLAVGSGASNAVIHFTDISKTDLASTHFVILPTSPTTGATAGGAPGVGNGGGLFTSTVTLAGLSSQYAITPLAGSATLSVQQSTLSPTIVADGSVIQFSDGAALADPTGQIGDVERLYQAALHRAPDLTGIEYWANQAVTNNVPLATIAADFAASPEFVADYGNLSNGAFIQQLYQNVFARSADATGLNFWTNALNAGESRGGVLQFFAESDENRANTINLAGSPNDAEAYRLYQAAFDRTPDQAGLDFWSNDLTAGASVSQVAAAFAATPEFAGDFARDTDAQYVAQLYQNVLGRAGDTTGLAYWTGQLASGATRATVLEGFADSQENLTRTSSATHYGWVLVPN